MLVSDERSAGREQRENKRWKVEKQDREEETLYFPLSLAFVKGLKLEINAH